jgi:hypothetical protein
MGNQKNAFYDVEIDELRNVIYIKFIIQILKEQEGTDT